MGSNSTAALSDFFDESELGETDLASPDDLFSIFEAFETVLGSKAGEEMTTRSLVSQKSTCSSSAVLQEYSETELEASPKCKRQKLTATASNSDQEANPDGQQRMSHITVERNRRKQMNDHLSILRSLMPSFYVKRGDQASIVGGVVDYITELQQVVQSLEAKKQRKVYSEVLLSPRLVSSPRPLPVLLSPRKPPLSPRGISLPISPRTPQRRPSSPYYKPRLVQQAGYLSPTTSNINDATNSVLLEPSSSSIDNIIANSKSAIADVEVKFSGPNVLLKTTSPRIRGQALKIIAAVQDLSLEILHVSIRIIDETMLNSFTIKIGIECQLSAEELAHQIQQTFC